MKKDEISFLVYCIVFMLMIGVFGFFLGYNIAAKRNEDIYVSASYESTFIDRESLLDIVKKTPKNCTVMVVEHF